VRQEEQLKEMTGTASRLLRGHELSVTLTFSSRKSIVKQK
jgi:hypothetical protein